MNFNISKLVYSYQTFLLQYAQTISSLILFHAPKNKNKNPVRIRGAHTVIFLKYNYNSQSIQSIPVHKGNACTK